MKRFIGCLIIASFALVAFPAFANNWQWQLEQIKADQQRRAKRAAAEEAALQLVKPDAAKQKATLPDRAPAPTPPAK